MKLKLFVIFKIITLNSISSKALNASDREVNLKRILIQIINHHLLHQLIKLQNHYDLENLQNYQWTYMKI